MLEAWMIVFSKYLALWSIGLFQLLMIRLLWECNKICNVPCTLLGITGYSASFNYFLSHQSSAKKMKNIFVCLLPVSSFLYQSLMLLGQNSSSCKLEIKFFCRLMKIGRKLGFSLLNHIFRPLNKELQTAQTEYSVPVSTDMQLR